MKRKISLTLIFILAISCTLLSQPQLDKAKELLKEKRAQEAVPFCYSFLQNNSRDENGWLLLAQAYLQIGMLDSAEYAAKRVVQLEDEMMEGYTILARIQRMQKNFKGAYETARAGFKARPKGQPKNVPLLIEYALTLLATDSIDGAQVAASEAKELDPAISAAYEILGDTYVKQKVAPMAIMNYEKSLELDTAQLVVLYKLAEVYKKERQYTQAAQVYSRILNLDSNNDSARLELGRLFYRAKQWVKCVQTFKEYFTKEKNPPKDIQAMYLEALFVSKQYKDAFGVAQEYLKVEPNSALANRAYAYGLLNDKNYAKAVDAFKKLATIDTMDSDDYRWLGSAHKQLKQDSLAVKAFEESLKDTTQTIQARSYMLGETGTVWMKYKEWEKAADSFRKRIQIDTSAVGSAINLALCLIQLEKYEDAIAVLKNAINQNPKYAPAYVNLGFCYYQMKDYESGKKQFELAIKVIDTAEVKYRIELADSYRMIAIANMMEKVIDPEKSRKKWEDAIVTLKKSLKFKDDMAQTHLLIGQCNQNLNKIDEAIKEYKRTLELDPKNKEAKKYLEDLLKLKENQ